MKTIIYDDSGNITGVFNTKPLVPQAGNSVELDTDLDALQVLRTKKIDDSNPSKIILIDKSPSEIAEFDKKPGD